MSALPDALADLVAERRWLLWRWEKSDTGKPTKVPFRGEYPSRHARSNDPATWCEHATAAAAVAAGKADGIGYALMSGVIGAFDLDDALDPAGNPLPWAWELIRECGSYVERTVGGNGLRILGFAEGGKVHRKFKIPGTASSVEAYRQAERYIVVTGAALEGHGGELRNIDAAIDACVARLDVRTRARSSGSSAGAAGLKTAKPCDGSDLPTALFELIRNGVPSGQRSEKFFYVVAALKGLGYDVDDVEELLVYHLTGIAEKFEHRLRAEIERAYKKADAPFDPGTWFEPPRPDPVFAFEGEATRVPPLRLIDPTQYQGLPIPPRRWLIRDWAPWGYVTGLYGEGGLGKSARRPAAADGRGGRPLLARARDGAGPVARVLLRGLGGGALAAPGRDRPPYGCDFEDLDAARWMSRLGDENLLITVQRPHGAVSSRSCTQDHRGRPRPPRRARHHRHGVRHLRRERERPRASPSLRVAWCLGTMAREIGGSVLCLAHPSRAGIASGSGDGGSTGWSAAFRSRYRCRCRRTEKGDLADPDARELSRKKANYAAREDAIPLRWRAGALVLDAPAGADRGPQRPCAEVFLALLDELTGDDRPVSDNSRAGNYAPKMFAMQPDRDGYSHRLRTRDGAAVRGQERSASRLRPKIGRAPTHRPHRRSQAVAEVAA